uniref:Uncharacterized protein n=1 Tax=Plectus sambesii TaxID=2011161 RepID=A0A914UZ04_9BILA
MAYRLPLAPPTTVFDSHIDCLLEKLPESFVRRLVDYLPDFERAQLFIFVRQLTKMPVWDQALRVRDEPFNWKWMVEREIPQFQNRKLIDSVWMARSYVDDAFFLVLRLTGAKVYVLHVNYEQKCWRFLKNERGFDMQKFYSNKSILRATINRCLKHGQLVFSLWIEYDGGQKNMLGVVFPTDKYDKDRRYYMKMERVYDVDLEDEIPLEAYLRRVRPVNVIGSKNTRVLSDHSRLWFRLGERHTGPEFVSMKLGEIPLNFPHPDNTLDTKNHNFFGAFYAHPRWLQLADPLNQAQIEAALMLHQLLKDYSTDLTDKFLIAVPCMIAPSLYQGWLMSFPLLVDHYGWRSEEGRWATVVIQLNIDQQEGCSKVQPRSLARYLRRLSLLSLVRSVCAPLVTNQFAPDYAMRVCVGFDLGKAATEEVNAAMSPIRSLVERMRDRCLADVSEKRHFIMSTTGGKGCAFGLSNEYFNKYDAVILYGKAIEDQKHSSSQQRTVRADITTRLLRLIQDLSVISDHPTATMTALSLRIIDPSIYLVRCLAEMTYSYDNVQVEVWRENETMDAIEKKSTSMPNRRLKSPVLYLIAEGPAKVAELITFLIKLCELGSDPLI